jgi:hypothetical protein
MKNIHVKILFIVFTLFISSKYYAQIANVTTVADPLPKSDIGDFKDIGLTDGFIYENYNKSSKTSELVLFDAKNFSVKGRANKKEYNDYKNLGSLSSYYSLNDVELKQNVLYLYVKKATSGYDVFAAKVGQQLAFPETPQYLFNIDDVGKYKQDVQNYTLKARTNENKDLCLFTFKKVKGEDCTYYLYLYDNNLKFLKSDSIITKYKDKDRAEALVYTNGYAIVKPMENKNNVLLNDVKNNKKYTIDIAIDANFISVDNIRSISAEKTILFGRYYTATKDTRVKGGVYKITYNTKMNSIESQIYLNPLLTAAEENQPWFDIIRNFISDDGACYAIVTQTIGAQYYPDTKFEIVCLNTETEKWKKQIPMRNFFSSSIKMALINGNLWVHYIGVIKHDKSVDFNNFNYRFVSAPAHKWDISILRINAKTGYVQHQSIELDNVKSDNSTTEERTRAIFCNNSFYGVHGSSSSTMFKIDIDK